jgi:nickel-type superoxide dismutase maturation protease
MLPTYRPGDWLVVRRGARIRPGDVVVARRPDRPSLLLVKRAVRRTATGWWLEGDNPDESDDSRLFGPVEAALVEARVLGRYWPLRR